MDTGLSMAVHATIGVIGTGIALSLLSSRAAGRVWIWYARLAASAALLTASIWCMFLFALRIEFARLDLNLPWDAVARCSTIAAVGVAASLGIISFGSRNTRNVALAGSLLSAAVSCMIFAAMSSLAAPAVLAYDLARVLLAMAASGAFCAVGMWRLGGAGGSRAIAALLIVGSLMLLSIASLSSILPFSEWNIATATPGAMAFRPDTVVFLSELAVTVVLGLAGVGIDREAAVRVEHENDRLRQLSESTFEGLLIHRGGIVLDANSAFCALIGRPLDQIVGHRVPAFLAAAEPCAPLLPASRRPEAVEIEISAADGATLQLEMLSREIPYVGGTAQVTALRDVRERRAAEARIRYLAEHDALTGLPNRARFLDVMARQLAVARRDGTTIALFCIDLDRFKSVNDTLGHQAGDLLLRLVSERMTNLIRACDMVGRVDGDEFLLLQTSISRPEDAEGLAARLLERLVEPYELDGHQACIGASIGIALGPRDATESEALINHADVAMYRAKTSGRGQFCFYKHGMDTRLRERREMEQDIGRALAAGEFALVYQPLFGGPSAGDLAGCEALLRWTHATRGAIRPDQFIPVAEDTGLILPLGNWVLETACREAASWPSPCRVAVNVSPRQLASGDFAAVVADVLCRTGLEAARLDIEITESALMSDADAALPILRRLKELGVRLVLDDFGTGYSSLSYLQRFPFDSVKIDKCFVELLPENDGANAIVRAILAMCHQLHLDVTAEGVENEAQLTELLARECDLFQGFLLARPMSGEAFREFQMIHAPGSDRVDIREANAGLELHAA